MSSHLIRISKVRQLINTEKDAGTKDRKPKRYGPAIEKNR